MKIKLPQLLLRYIVEGVLIFVSVYGAFLLEDYRSKSEQKEIFRNRWKGLINSISTDSIKFTDMLHDIDDRANINLNEWLNRDSTILADYDQLIGDKNIRPIIEAVGSSRYWAMSYTEEPPFYQDIIDNHPDHYMEVCLESPQICEWLDLYFQYHRRIDRFNRFAREMHIGYWGKIQDSYAVPKVASAADSIGLAGDFRSLNYLVARHNHSKNLTLPTVRDLVELNKKLSPALRDVLTK